MESQSKTVLNNSIDNKQRIINELKIFLSLKPSDNIIVEQIPYGNKKGIYYSDVNVIGLVCTIGENNFIIQDDKIIHIKHDRLQIFNKERILQYKNSNSIGIDYQEACLRVEKLILEQDICTIPFDDLNNNLGEKNVSVVMFIGSNNIPFDWVNLVLSRFKIYKKINCGDNDILNPIKIGYYKRDNEYNIIDNEPYLDHCEEMTRYEDKNCLLLHSPLSYKK